MEEKAEIKVVGPSLLEKIKTEITLKIQNTRLALYDRLPNMPTAAGVK